jgi:hypothetical protein
MWAEGEGVLIYKDESYRRPYSLEWDMEFLEPYYGEIILENRYLS